MTDRHLLERRKMIKDIMEVVRVLKHFANRDVKSSEREDIINEIQSINSELAKELKKAIWRANQKPRWVKDYSADME